MILDTNFLVDLLRDRDGVAKRKAAELDQTLVVKAVSSVTVLELWRGALRSVHSLTEMKKINELLRSLLIYPFGEEEAKKAVEIEAELLKTGEAIDWEDILIAGTAIVKNQPVLTKNIKHFKKIFGLQVETY